MKSLKPYLKPLFIIGSVLIITVIISWFAFPGWRAQPGGLWLLIGVAAVGIAAIAKVTLDIAKTWKDLNEPAAQSQSEPKLRNQEQDVGGSKRVKQVGKKGATQRQKVRDSEDVTQEIS